MRITVFLIILLFSFPFEIIFAQDSGEHNNRVAFLQKVEEAKKSLAKENAQKLIELTKKFSDPLLEEVRQNHIEEKARIAAMPPTSYRDLAEDARRQREEFDQMFAHTRAEGLAKKELFEISKNKYPDFEYRGLSEQDYNFLEAAQMASETCENPGLEWGKILDAVALKNKYRQTLWDSIVSIEDVYRNPYEYLKRIDITQKQREADLEKRRKAEMLHNLKIIFGVIVLLIIIVVCVKLKKRVSKKPLRLPQKKLDPIETPSKSSTDELRKYYELLREGVIQQEEYDKIKSRILGI